MQNKPLQKIGENILFSKGTTLSSLNGKNEYIDTPPAMITIAGIVMQDGEWFYHDAFNTSVLYPESSIVTE